jgi:hypothetical protein
MLFNKKFPLVFPLGYIILIILFMKPAYCNDLNTPHSHEGFSAIVDNAMTPTW